MFIVDSEIASPVTRGQQLATRAWSRLEQLFDPDSMCPIGPQARAEVATATGTVRGVATVAFATNPDARGGALTQEGCLQIVTAIEAATRSGRCVIGIWQSGGAALQQGVVALDAVGEVFRAIVAASGIAPQVSVVCGPAAGGASYGSALSDLVVMERNATMFVTGPGVVRDVTGQDVDMAGLGGAAVHERESGVAHLVCDGEPATLHAARELISLLGDQGTFDLRRIPEVDSDLSSILPDSRQRAYDVGPLIDRILDAPALILQPRWAPNVVTALGRLAGRTVGVVANNPLRMGGCLDARAGDKAARFVRMCDAYGVPLIVLVDVPGYLPGVDQEREGVLRRGAKLLHAFSACEVSRVTLITRKAFGGAYIAMNSRSLGATAVYAWPEVEVDVMNAESAVRVLHRRVLTAIVDDTERVAAEARLAAAHRATLQGLSLAVEKGLINAVIEPRRTRWVLSRALAAAPPRAARRPNIPL
jgi:acetyl-CoA/propionyl-CoA carboxylase carboxyl transferase subunit